MFINYGIRSIQKKVFTFWFLFCFSVRPFVSNPQKITCIIFENLFGPYFLPHQSHIYGYAPSSGENLTSKMSFKSDATYDFHITNALFQLFK